MGLSSRWLQEAVGGKDECGGSAQHPAPFLPFLSCKNTSPNQALNSAPFPEPCQEAEEEEEEGEGDRWPEVCPRKV